jgi:flagellar biosynthesis protein
MIDQTDDGKDLGGARRFLPLNLKKKPARVTAVAVRDAAEGQNLPTISAAGRGVLAEQILRIAFDNGVKVREDSALAEMLASIEIDSPIPSEAFMAVAEILQYVYRANNAPNPFDAPVNNAQDREDQNGKDS